MPATLPWLTRFLSLLLLLLLLISRYEDYLVKNPDSLLLRILGAHCLRSYSSVFYFFVMENLFNIADDEDDDDETKPNGAQAAQGAQAGRKEATKAAAGAIRSADTVGKHPNEPRLSKEHAGKARGGRKDEELEEEEEDEEATVTSQATSASRSTAASQVSGRASRALRSGLGSTNSHLRLGFTSALAGLLCLPSARARSTGSRATTTTSARP